MSNESTPMGAAFDASSHTTSIRTLRAVDYLRVSTEEQRLGYGLASQCRKNSRYIDGKNWTHVTTYSDKGVSGSKEMGQRPNFDRLMRDAAEQMFDVVVVEKGDRIGRVGRAFWRWVWALEDMGIFVALVSRTIDNTTAEGRAQMRREADYAESEWENIRARTQGGLQEKAHDAGSPHIGGPPPFGYRVQGKGLKGSQLITDDDESEVIRLVYRMIVEDGLSMRKAAVRLNAQGITTRSGKPWSQANLRDRILSRAILDGTIIFRGENAKTDPAGNPIWGEPVTITLPRILSGEESATLRKAATRTLRTDGRRAFYPLTGRVIGLCGATYTGINRDSIPGLGRAYRCSGKAPTIPGDPVCGCSYIDAPALESRVWAEVVGLLRDPRRLEMLAADWVGMAQGDAAAHSERINELDRQIVVQNSAMAAVIAASAKQAAVRGLTAEAAGDAIAEATTTLNAELAQLQQMRNEAAVWLSELEETDRRAQDLQRLAELARFQLTDVTPMEQADILSLLDIKVYVEGPVPARKSGVPCTVQTWYRSAGLGVPAADLTDERWRKIEPLLPAGRNGTIRRVVNAILHKARSGSAWPALRAVYGSTSTASKYFVEWSEDGAWERVEQALGGCERVPVPVVDLLPPMRIEGRIDPRLMLNLEKASRRGWRLPERSR